MTDSGAFFGGELPGDDELLRFLARFGIAPGPDGRLDPNQIVGKLQGLMGSFSTQMAGYGPSDRESGMNWAFARSIAERALTDAAEPRAAKPPRQVLDAVTLADLWLDDEIVFDRIAAPARLWARAEWIDTTFPTWQRLLAPIVTSLSAAIGNLMPPGGDDPLQTAMRPMVRMAATGMLASQLGQSLGTLAQSVLSSGDLGLPLTSQPVVAFVTGNVGAFAAGLGVDDDDVWLFLALREVARQRLFGAVGWLGPQLLALVTHYARDIRIDPSSLQDAVQGQFGDTTDLAKVDLANLERASEAFAESLFAPSVTGEQREVLDRLETLLAIVEGWVDDVVAEVTRPRMPSAAGLSEALRRRGASATGTRTALKRLIGLELEPRRTRDAANTWAALRVAHGSAARDAAWGHPDVVPSSADLDDPLGYVERVGRPIVADDFDSALAQLLDDEGNRPDDPPAA